MDIVYLLECALVIAEREKRGLLAYLISMAIIEACDPIESVDRRGSGKSV